MYSIPNTALLIAACLTSSASALPIPDEITLAPYGIVADAKAVAGRQFDYIVCGGGLTGLTVASKLTEDRKISVLVIEAGQDYHEDPRVNDVRTYGQAFNSELDWNITSTPVAWQDGAELPLIAGKMLGGSGSLNGASWTKGPKSQYDLLPLLTGDDSWAWETFNKFMLQAEHFNKPDQHEIASGAQYSPAYHGETGPVDVSFADGIFASPQKEALEASQKVWEHMNIDPDAADGTVDGATIIPNMVLSDQSQNRSSPFTAYVEEQVKQRENFVILTGHRVIRIDWKDGPKLAAKGVTFQACRDCESHQVETKHEVLLAAGSLQSPQILELSGVGDRDVLAPAGVPVKMEMPAVGRHMQEQTKNSLYLTSQSQEFKGSGPPSAIAFPNIHQLLKENASSTYENVMNGLAAHAADLADKGLVVNAAATLKILEAQLNNLFIDNAPAAEVFFTISPVDGQLGIDLWNLIVLSRGTCHIRSSSSWDRPVVEPSYFGHPLDLAIQIAASKQSRQVYQTEPLAGWVSEEKEPGIAVGPENGDDDWEQWVKESFTSVWHYIATLAMMEQDKGGAVSSRFKVYGIENVRVVDASVLPIQLSAHLSSSLYGIALKAAKTIQEDR